jgi:hypothetical protein
LIRLSLRQNARFAWYQQEWNRIYYPDYLDPTDQRTLYRYPLSWHGPWQTHEVDTSLECRVRFLALCAKGRLIKSPFVKGAASEPVLSEVEGCRKWLACNAALAAEVMLEINQTAAG